MVVHVSGKWVVVYGIACHDCLVVYLLIVLVVSNSISLSFVMASLSMISSNSNGLVVSELDCCLS